MNLSRRKRKIECAKIMKLPVDTYMYNQPYVTTMSFDSRVERITLTRQKVRSFHKSGRNALKTLHGSNRIGRCFGNTKKKETIERLKLRVDEASNDNDRCVRLLSSFNRVFRVYDLSIILRKRKKEKEQKEGQREKLFSSGPSNR